VDIYTNPDELRALIDVLVKMNLYAIGRYRTAGADGFIFCDDWGLQDRLMISPDTWREFWKPAYARVYAAARDAGLQTFLHSCGYIIDILPDLIEIGLDVIQMDQQQNMGLDNLGLFAGKITFWCPVDIQATMCRGSLDDIRAYCHKLVEKLGTPRGGFLPKWYGDPVGAGHRQDAIDAMCQEFLQIQP
jgi:uroporphyrinogen-III decarboxylase